MIQKIDIKKYGSYQDFIWNKEIPDSTFKKLNIIYGRNYSGKTTLSRMFGTLEQKRYHLDYIDSDFDFILENSSILQSKDGSIFSNTYQIKVFNSDFIKSNLNWLYNNEGSIEPFTVLGEKNVQLLKEIKAKEIELGSEENKSSLLWELKNLTEEKDETKRKLYRLEKDLSDLLSEKAREIRGNQKLYAKDPYNKTNLLKDIEKTRNYTELSESEYGLLVSQLDEKELPSIKYMSLGIDDFNDIIKASIEALNKKVTINEPIQELLNDSLLSAWVQEGIERHGDNNSKCKFCGNIIESYTWEKLTHHFNKDGKKLDNFIMKLINSCKVMQERLYNGFNFTEDNIYLVFKDDYFNILEKWNKIKNDINNEFKQLIVKLEEKQKNITKVYDFSFNYGVLESIKDINIEIKKLINKNTQKTTSLLTDKKTIHEKILMSDIIKFLKNKEIEKLEGNIRSVKEEKEAKLEQWKAKNEEIKGIQREIENLKKQEKDESRGAKRVNEYLKKYFGSDEIQFVPVETDGIMEYKIIRNNKEAKNLSDGECSLISFCYYIAKIEDLLRPLDADEIVNSEVAATLEPVTKNKVVIYIDDPISSLDNNHIFFVFSIIEEIITKSPNLHQLFISTHNLDFLKYLKKLTCDNKDTEYFIIKRDKCKEDPRSIIELMPKHLKEYVTEFNYLFSEMYKLYGSVRGSREHKINNTYNQYYSLPNNIRKFLEFYLFYRYPNNDGFMVKLNKMFSDNVPVIINRVINEYSHLTYIERAWKPFDVPELEKCVKIIFEEMKKYDEEQFNMLVASVKK